MISLSVETRAKLKAMAEEASIPDTEAQIVFVRWIENTCLQLTAGPGAETPMMRSKLEQDFKRLERALDELPRALGLKDADPPEDGVRPGPFRDCLEYQLGGQDGPKGEAKLRSLLLDVGKLGDLRDAAWACRQDIVKGKIKRKDRHKGDEVLNDLIIGVLEAYRAAGGKPSISYNVLTRKIGGQSFQLVRAFLELIKATYPDMAHLIPGQTDRALVSRIKRIIYRKLVPD
jgi:hypothetical protein